MALRSCSRHSSPPASPSPPPSPPPPPPCLACPSTEALPLVLPLTDQTSCPSRLKFRQQLLTRLGLPSTVAYLPLTELPPRALRCLCAQLIDSFRICYMSDQDLYFADAVALELHKEARRRRRERRDGKKGASTQAKDVSEICAEHDGVTEHAGTDSEDSRMPPEVRGAAGVLPIVMAPDVLEEWGLLSGCESPSNLRRALFEIQNRLRYLSLREGETNAAIPPMAEYAAVSLGPSASSSSASPASSPPDRAVTLRQYTSHMQHLIDRFCAPANAPVGADAEVDVSFTKKYHEEAKKLGVHIHPSIQIVKIPGAGRGLMASESIPAGTPVVDVPEKAMLNVYAGLKDPVFSHIVKFLLSLRPSQTPDETNALEYQKTVSATCDRETTGDETGYDGPESGKCTAFSVPISPSASQREASLCSSASVPLVDTDTVTLLYFLFEVERGEKSTFRFFFQDMLPPPRDETQQPLLVGPPELPEFLGDTPLMRTIDESQLKAFSLFRRLLPVLRDTFGSYEKFVALCFCEKARDSHMEGNAGDDTDEEKLRAHWAEISAFLQSLDLQKFIWAQSLMGSRAFSVKVPPPVVLPGWQVEERSEETNAENHEEVQRPAGGEDVHESNSDEHFAANEETKEYSWHGGLTAAKEKRATVSGNESGSESSKTEGAALVGGAENGDNAAAPEGSMKRAKVCGDLEMLHPQTSSGGRTGRARSGGPGAVEGREQSRGAVEEDAASDSDSVPFLPELRERRNDPPVYRARFCSSSSGGMPRCSPGSAGGDAQEGDPAPVICVPDHPTTFLLFADMMNHHVHSQCAFPFFDSATRSARMVVQAHVPPGAQLFMFYGPMQSWELFAHYGFSTSSFFALENNHAHTKDNSADQDAAVTRERPPCCGNWNFTLERNGNPYDTLTMSFEPPDDDPDEVTRRLLLRLFEVPYEALLRTGAPHFSSRLLDCLHISLYPNVDELVTSMHTRRRGLEREEREEREEQRDEERQGTEGANRQKGEGSGGTGCDGEKVSNPGHQLCSAQPKEKLCHHLWRLEILMRREAELLRRDTEGFEEQQAGDSSLPTRNREDLNAERPPKGPHETTSETSCSAEHVVARRMRGRNTMAYAREEEADWDQETDDGEDDLVNKACCVPVAQTAYELLEARREGLRQLSAWHLDETERPHWYDSWGSRAEVFLENQVTLFSRIHNLFSD